MNIVVFIMIYMRILLQIEFYFPKRNKRKRNIIGIQILKVCFRENRREPEKVDNFIFSRV